MEGSRGQPGKAQRPAWKGIVGPQEGRPPVPRCPRSGFPFSLHPICFLQSPDHGLHDRLFMSLGSPRTGPLTCP